MSNTTTLTLPLPDDFPWEQTIGLLLDAVQVNTLLPRLYEWDAQATIELLYLRTRLTQFRELSPCLVRVKGADDPILKQFLRHTKEHWGYLVISDAPWQQVTAHWRWLVSVEHPSGVEMLLRLADPAVALALLDETGAATARLFGPCVRVMVANPLLGTWTDCARPGEAPESDHSALYRLSETQMDQLNRASRHNMLADLYKHMVGFFPDYLAQWSPLKRWQHLSSIVETAGDLGFESEADTWLYANAHGFLNQEWLLADPEIDSLLSSEPRLPAATRRAMLTQLVERRSHA